MRAIGTRGCARAEEQAVAQGRTGSQARRGSPRRCRTWCRRAGLASGTAIQCVFDGVVRRPVEELGDDVEAVPDAACDSRGDDGGGTEVAGRSVGLTCPKLQTAVSAVGPVRQRQEGVAVIAGDVPEIDLDVGAIG